MLGYLEFTKPWSMNKHKIR